MPIDHLWYRKNLPWYLWFFIPLSWLVSCWVLLRRTVYQKGFRRTHSFSVPIIVVGNITVGGTGKTPLVIHLFHLLESRGWRPGIVSRGYKPFSFRLTRLVQLIKNAEPIWVDPNSPVERVGDEPLLLATQLKCPVVICPNRVRAVRSLIQSGRVDVILSDDGLQHYAMGRTLSVAVIDAARGFGNGWFLPLGPLREPISRLKTVDFIVANGTPCEENQYDMVLEPKSLSNGLQTSFSQSLDAFRGKTVHAIAGIGNPSRFFDMLRERGVTVIPHAFPDHHAYVQTDILFGDARPIVMTEKDAIKCRAWMTDQHWIVKIDARVNPLFDAKIILLLQEKING